MVGDNGSATRDPLESRKVAATDMRGAKKGDEVTRWMGGEIVMNLIVTEVTETRVICGSWEFDRATGAEIDEDLGWGVNGTGSFIRPA